MRVCPSCLEVIKSAACVRVLWGMLGLTGLGSETGYDLPYPLKIKMQHWPLSPCSFCLRLETNLSETHRTFSSPPGTLLGLVRTPHQYKFLNVAFGGMRASYSSQRSAQSLSATFPFGSNSRGTPNSGLLPCWMQFSIQDPLAVVWPQTKSYCFLVDWRQCFLVSISINRMWI